MATFWATSTCNHNPIESMKVSNGLLDTAAWQARTYRVTELCVEPIAQLVDPGRDLVELDRLLPAISFYDIHGC